ncbi:MAG: hypothetical protein AB7I30_01340, partial [Isosphaeraceae bacterium]
MNRVASVLARASLVIPLFLGGATRGVAQVPSPPAPGSDAPVDATAIEDAGPVRVLTEGPLHEAFLSPVKSAEPDHVAKAPPAPIVERPGIDPPDARAQWIEGYWGWEEGRKDFVWVTGTWRVPPPGKFWVNGYWKRDDQGWYRVPGFWSDRKTDRIDFRKDGPPTNRPAEEPGESPGPGHFYIPGQYYPDGDGVVWKPGFWTKSQPGWSWVPAQWVRQPEGWTFQEGYWDRNLEDRGVLFAPAEVAEDARNATTVFAPYTQVGPQSFGLLYGAFGRPNADYDGYPGCYYDPTGRYYGYANYGCLGAYYGYLDYPYYGTIGYPYLTSGLTYAGVGVGVGGFGLGLGSGYGYGFGLGGPCYGLLGGTIGGLCGFGLGGLGYSYCGYGVGLGYSSIGLGLGGLGYPYYGYGGFGGLGYSNFGYGGFGYPYCGYGGVGGLGFGLGFGTGLGLGLATCAFGGGGYGPWYGYGGARNAHRTPFYPGRQTNALIVNGNNNNVLFAPNARVVNLGQGQGGLTRGGRGGVVTRGNTLPRPLGPRVSPPPSSRPFANPFLRQASDLYRQRNIGSLANQAGPREAGPIRSATGGSALAKPRGTAGSVSRPSVTTNALRGGWSPAFNGENLQATALRRSVARPVFTNSNATRPGLDQLRNNLGTRLGGQNGSPRIERGNLNPPGGTNPLVGRGPGNLPNALPRIERGNLNPPGGSSAVVGRGPGVGSGSVGALPGLRGPGGAPLNLGNNPSTTIPRGPGARGNGLPNLGAGVGGSGSGRVAGRPMALPGGNGGGGNATPTPFILRGGPSGLPNSGPSGPGVT